MHGKDGVGVMRKFKAIKTREQVLAQCRAQGVQVDQRLYQQGSDFTVLRAGGAEVLWSSWNGKFFGTFQNAKGREVRFDSSSAKHEHEPWFQGLLEFFYTNETRSQRGQGKEV
jgi:hypothetical protein